MWASCLSPSSNEVEMLHSLRFSLSFLFVACFSSLFIDSAEARILGRRAVPCVPMTYCSSVPQVCYGSTVSLIGDDLSGWTALGGGPQRGGWSVVDGTLHLKGSGGDLVTERQYKNFVLDFEWTIAEGGNSGIKYRYKNFDDDGWLGLEYQVLDDFGTSEGNRAKSSTASLYDILPPNSQKSLNSADQINKGRIVVNGNRIEHWLNGQKVLSVVVGSKEIPAFLSPTGRQPTTTPSLKL